MFRTALLTAPIALAACVEYRPEGPDERDWVSNPPPIDEVTQEDRIVQVQTPKVDILWTIDNSGSMGPFQQALATSFPAFMGYFTDSGLDYHIGVTSTDIDNDRNGTKGKLVRAGENLFIEVDTPAPEDVFAAMASLGTDGSSAEKGLGGTYLALEVERDEANAGFYRDEAAIHTIVISDEPDSTQPGLITQPEFVDWYDGLKDEADMRSFSAIIRQSNGVRYRNTAGSIGGIVWDILGNDWPGLLERLGVQAAGLKREYFLSRLPVPGTLEVAIDDQGVHRTYVECAAHDFDELGELLTDCDYTYSPSRNSITFVEVVPNPLSTIILTYQVLASQADQTDVQ